MKNKKASVNILLAGSLLITLGLFGCGGMTGTSATETLEQDAFKHEVVLAELIPQQQLTRPTWFNSVTSAFSIEDNNAIKVTFKASENISKLSITPPTPWQLSELPDHNIAFDVKNLSPHSSHVYMVLLNPKGENQRRSIALPKGFDGTVYFPISGKEAETDTGFWGDAPAWQTADQFMVWRSWRASQVDVSTISSIAFQTIGLLEDNTLKISNLRIRQNPPSDPNWMQGVLDKFGQNAKYQTAQHVQTEPQLYARGQAELAECKSVEKQC